MIELKEIDYPELTVDYLLKLNREMFTSPLINLTDKYLKIIKDRSRINTKMTLTKSLISELQKRKDPIYFIETYLRILNKPIRLNTQLKNFIKHIQKSRQN